MGSASRAGARLHPIVLAAVGFVVGIPMVVAFHWGQQGWRDHHENYPSRPQGYTQIVNRFGQPCSANARAISMSWRAADTGTTYRFPFHLKLGGRRTGQERLRHVVGGHLVELGDVVHDAIHLVHQPVQLALSHRELRQPGHVQDLVPSDAHALSHSRSRPA